ncbi:hypothetical protein LOTGIDRAFT_157833 [Lottia gigantea]|uniref:peptidylglycine monooxygenase n=1 Tax=Lottia gigantea TaxID=225164 RepID=V4B2G1_LOTGI|nr:hypothetical protein LOTGIDRAFT_157833 [Lottia gigantea]ESP00557.1 hypothetical protein LOTGIDRAFT_157833 [Lottia gigantea]
MDLTVGYISLCVVFGIVSVITQDVDHKVYNLTIRMPNVISPRPDALVCHGIKLDPEETYVVSYIPHASADVAHHMMVFGCILPASHEPSWLCNENHEDFETEVCGKGEKQVVFAWALDAPSFQFPDGVGLRLSGTTGVNYIVIQLHYKHIFPPGRTDNSGVTLQMTRERQPKQAGFYVIGTHGYIPPKQRAFTMETACKYENEYPIYPIGYRTHSHNLGVVTSGYRIRDGTWIEIGRMSPQLPETFYNVTNHVEVRPGDVLAARCTMNSVKRTHNTHIGPTNADEMCNFYVLYYTYWKPNLQAQFCFRNAQDFHWNDYFENIPDTASSLVGIKGVDKVRKMFDLHPPLAPSSRLWHDTM